MKRSLPVRLLALLAVVALVAAACGASGDQAAPEGPLGGSDASAVLPTNPNPDETPPIAGTCLEGEPDCQDTLAPGQEPSDLPPPLDASDGPASPGGMLVDGGRTVTDALASDVTGIIAVKGFLLIDGQSARLCEGFAESAPPLCMGASINVTGYQEVLSVPLTTAQGVSWTDQSVSLLGEIVDGTLVVDATVSQ